MKHSPSLSGHYHHPLINPMPINNQNPYLGPKIDVSGGSNFMNRHNSLPDIIN